MRSSPENVTQMLRDWSRGNQAALAQLIPIIYDDLRRQAARHLRRERPEHTLQTTALIHEAYIRLVNQQPIDWQDRGHFFAIAARTMRQILVDHARRQKAGKRGGAERDVTLDEAVAGAAGPGIDYAALDEALSRLEALNERQARVVELRHFAGLSVEETAEVLQVSAATVKNDWSAARAWLRGQLEGAAGT
jgi:RNA polymerase sigma factor (TIGR02999 family)